MEEKISELKSIVVEISRISRAKKEKNMKKSEDSLKDLQDNNKQINIHIMGVPEERENGAENYSKK